MMHCAMHIYRFFSRVTIESPDSCGKQHKKKVKKKKNQLTSTFVSLLVESPEKQIMKKENQHIFWNKRWLGFILF